MVNDTMRAAGTDLPTWAKQHEVSFELAPFQETVKGRGVQHTGYELRLFGRFEPGPEHDERVHSVHEHLCLLAAEALQALPVRPLVQLAPAGRAVVPPDAPLVLEAELTVIASPGQAHHLLPPAELRELTALIEGRLRALGTRKR